MRGRVGRDVCVLFGVLHVAWFWQWQLAAPCSVCLFQMVWDSSVFQVLDSLAVDWRDDGSILEVLKGFARREVCVCILCFKNR